MSKPSHTPGPWTAAKHGPKLWQIDAANDAVATTAFCYSQEVAANARLIAAAPDLYEALHNTLTLLRAFVTRDDDIARVTLEQAEAALIKARGEG